MKQMPVRFLFFTITIFVSLSYDLLMNKNLSKWSELEAASTLGQGAYANQERFVGVTERMSIPGAQTPVFVRYVS